MDKEAKIISGVVKDHTGKPISNAVISFVTAPVSVQDIAALTDTNGNFSLSVPSEGEYIIKVNSDRHNEKNIKIKIDRNQKRQIEVSLIPK
jgi:uncharacterized GH25 family protein